MSAWSVNLRSSFHSLDKPAWRCEMQHDGEEFSRFSRCQVAVRRLHWFKSRYHAWLDSYRCHIFCLLSLVWYFCRGEVPIWNDIWIQYYECSAKEGPYSVRTIIKWACITQAVCVTKKFQKYQSSDGISYKHMYMFRTKHLFCNREDLHYSDILLILVKIK